MNEHISACLGRAISKHLDGRSILNLPEKHLHLRASSFRNCKVEVSLFGVDERCAPKLTNNILSVHVWKMIQNAPYDIWIFHLGNAPAPLNSSQNPTACGHFSESFIRHRDDRESPYGRVAVP